MWFQIIFYIVHYEHLQLIKINEESDYLKSLMKNIKKDLNNILFQIR